MERDIWMNKLTSKTDFVTFNSKASFPFQNKVPSPCDTKILQRGMQVPLTIFLSLTSHHCPWIYPHPSNSRKRIYFDSPRDLCLLFPPFKAAYSFFLTCFSFTCFLRLRGNATFYRKDPSNISHSLGSKVPPLLYFQRKVQQCTSLS